MRVVHEDLIYPGIIRLYGAPKTGKTWRALEFIAAVQNRGMQTALVSTSLPPLYAMQDTGVDPNRVLVVDCTDDPSRALDAVTQLLQLGTNLVVLDTVADLAPPVDAHSDRQQASWVKGLSRRVRRFQNQTAYKGSCLVVTDLLRERHGTFVNKDVTVTGGAVGFYAKVWVRTDRRDLDGQGTPEFSVTVVRNRVPLQQAK